jgi:hypothetical protein
VTFLEVRMTYGDWAKLILKSNLLTAFVVGGFGLLTLWLGLRKFRSEKWWEKKATAYATSIDALHGMYDLSLAYVEAIEDDQEISDERLATLQAANLSGLSEVRKGASIGSFIMTERAASILSGVLKEFDKLDAQSKHEFHDTRAVILSDAIRDMTIEAKKDLRTP